MSALDARATAHRIGPTDSRRGADGARCWSAFGDGAVLQVYADRAGPASACSAPTCCCGSSTWSVALGAPRRPAGLVWRPFSRTLPSEGWSPLAVTDLRRRLNRRRRWCTPALLLVLTWRYRSSGWACVCLAGKNSPSVAAIMAWLDTSPAARCWPVLLLVPVLLAAGCHRGHGAGSFMRGELERA